MDTTCSPSHYTPQESPELVDFNEDDAVEPMVTTREPVFSSSRGHAAYADEMEEGV